MVVGSGPATGGLFNVNGAISATGGVSIGTTTVINSSGQWVGDPSGLVGSPGAPGADGADGAPGPPGTPNPNIITEGASSFNTAVGVEALVNNTGGNNAAMGWSALFNNTIGSNNTAIGRAALFNNDEGSLNTGVGIFALGNTTSGSQNTAIGFTALSNNHTGVRNTGIGYRAEVSTPNLVNATAIGAQAVVNASNKVRIGNTLVTRIEGQVAFTSVSDRNQKENFKPVDGEEVLEKIREIPVQSWNYIGHDPKEFRHYGPVAQDFFAAFGDDGVGTVGTPTTINSGDMQGILMIAVQALERLATEQREEIERLKSRLEVLENTGYGNNLLSDNNSGDMKVGQ